MTRAHRYADYAGRIERALIELERGASTGDIPKLARLASVAALSEFHFHRVFRIMTGETVGEAVARVRIGGSLPALATAEGIRAAVERSGYASTQAYARALKALTGATATQLRADAALRESVAEEVRRPAFAQDAGYGEAPPPMAVEIVSFAPVRLYAWRNTGDYAELNLGYAQLFELLGEQISFEDVTGLWGIPHDDPRITPPAQCRFDCAVTTAAPLDPRGGIRMIEVPGAPCLRLRIPGDYDQVHTALDDLYRIAICEGLELSDHLPVNFYHADPEEVPTEELVADIFLMLAEGEG